VAIEVQIRAAATSTPRTQLPDNAAKMAATPMLPPRWTEFNLSLEDIVSPGLKFWIDGSMRTAGINRDADVFLKRSGIDCPQLVGGQVGSARGLRKALIETFD